MIKKIKKIKEQINNLGLSIVGEDFTKPWGGFLIIDENQSKKFISHFISNEYLNVEGKISPKILFVNSKSRLSWQYHNRRKEIWSVVEGPVGVVKSKNNVENKIVSFHTGEIIDIKLKERHRIVGLNNHSIIAEIWIHIDLNNPSDEDDIIRLQDDYSRN